MSNGPAGKAAGTPAGTTVAAPDKPARRRTRGWLRRLLPRSRSAWLGLALAVTFVALVATGAVLLRTPTEDAVRDSALLAARTYTTSLTTFDARTLDEDVARVKRAATPQFAEQYDQTISGLRDSVQTEQTVSAGTVVGAGIEELTDQTATVLVAVNQQISGTSGQPRTEANRLRMVLERRDGRWLIRSVERL